MDARPDVAADAGELVIERFFDAPRALVWKCWTEEEHLAAWGAPHGFVVTECGGDLRVGGRWHSAMRSPDGTIHRNGGVYREIVAPERLVQTFAWLDEDGRPEAEMLVTVTLTENEDGKTRMVFRQTGFDNVSSRDGHGSGWNESFDKLAIRVGELAGT